MKIFDKKIFCYRIHKAAERGRVSHISVSHLTSADLQIQVHYSSVNYKDALAGLAASSILKKYPLNGGVDCAGVVVKSLNKAFQKGEEVLAHGCHLSEFTDGGYSQIVNVDSSYVVKKPKELTLRECMIIGTAGFTAALCLLRMSRNGQSIDKGPILVTGATGGVGCLSTLLFSSLGYEVWAMTGKSDKHGFLKSLGAGRVVSFEDLSLEKRSLAKKLFGGVIDNLGGEVLERVLPYVVPWGNVASVGLALSPSFSTTVMPFILRGVSLLGASSNNCSMSDRKTVWQNLGEKWRLKNLERIVSEEVELEGLNEVFQRMLDRKTWGRILVHIS